MLRWQMCPCRIGCTWSLLPALATVLERISCIRDFLLSPRTDLRRNLCRIQVKRQHQIFQPCMAHMLCCQKRERKISNSSDTSVRCLMGMLLSWLELRCCICDDEKIDEEGTKKEKKNFGRAAAGRRKIIVGMICQCLVRSDKNKSTST